MNYYTLAYDFILDAISGRGGTLTPHPQYKGKDDVFYV